PLRQTWPLAGPHRHGCGVHWWRLAAGAHAPAIDRHHEPEALMTRAQRNGLLVALIHLGIVGAVAAKFVVDRSNYPRLWVQAVPFDPDLPIRGRYVSLNAVVGHAEGSSEGTDHWRRVRLQVEGGRLAAIDDENGAHTIRWQPCGGNRKCWTLERPVAY